jgi:uroporphyrinogen decarboxylase
LLTRALTVTFQTALRTARNEGQASRWLAKKKQHMIFEPISYDHAARLINRRPWDVSRDVDLLVAAHDAAIRTYACSECTVGVDIYNLEIEAYGCKIVEPEGNGLPAAGPPPFDEISDLLSVQLDPVHDGRIPMLLDAATQLAEKHPSVRVRVPIAGPFTIACHLLGMENTLCELAVNPEPLLAVLLHLADNQLTLAREALCRGLGLSVFDSSVTPPLVSPDIFLKWVLPSLAKLLGGLPAQSKRETQLIIGGDTIHILDPILSLSPAYIICPVETAQEDFMAKVADHDDMVVRVNMKPSVFLPRMREAAKTEVERVLKLACRPRTTVGSVLPFDADPQIVSEITEWIEESQQSVAQRRG